jgi:hypothetical protein
MASSLQPLLRHANHGSYTVRSGSPSTRPWCEGLLAMWFQLETHRKNANDFIFSRGPKAMLFFCPRVSGGILCIGDRRADVSVASSFLQIVVISLKLDIISVTCDDVALTCRSRARCKTRHFAFVRHFTVAYLSLTFCALW